MRFFCVDSFEFKLDINPASLTTAQEKGVRIIKKGSKVIPMFYKKQRALENEKMILNALGPIIKHRYTIKNDGDTAVELKITYYFPHQSGTPKWKRDEITFMTQRPDADNISKALVDCMTKCGFWEDDSMVGFQFSKYRSPTPCIAIKISVWKQEKDNS